MNLRTILWSAVALPLAFGGPVSAENSGQDPAPHLLPGLSSLFGKREDRSYQVAQSNDPRITQLEDLVRQLNGRVEELNFQILQMQEQIRKQNEDNEYRFQQIEQKKGDASKGDKNVASAPAAVETGERVRPVRPPASDDAPAVAPKPVAPREAASNAAPSDDAVAGSDGEPGTGQPPRELGSITFDANGDPIAGSAKLPPPSGTSAPDRGTTVAALPKTSDPEELYRNAYDYVLSGDYPSAEAGFREHIQRYPQDQRAADAHFWLGESLLGQEKYRDAAEIFLAANKSYPKSRKAPDMLLKLGISLSAMNQRDVACATYGEIGKRYPGASGALKDRVKQEQALAGC